MKKYILYFCAAYAVAMIIITIIISFFDLPSGTSVGCLLAAGFATSAKFVKDNRRIPEAHEKKKLVYGCLLASLVISFLASIIALFLFYETAAFFQDIRTVPTFIWVIALGLTLLIHYCILAVSFGFFANNQVKALKKRQN